MPLLYRATRPRINARAAGNYSAPRVFTATPASLCGSEGAVYCICPVVKDPRDGGIAPDQFLAYTRKPGGTPLEPFFVRNFDSLRFNLDCAE